MNDFEKINTDLATLFREGRALLDNERLPGGSIP